MTITITRRDIQRGKRGSATDCPVALALRRVLNVPVEVWSDRVVAHEPDGRRVYLLPTEAQDFIRRFDQFVIKKATCPSLTFELAAGAEVLTSGYDDVESEGQEES